MLLISSHSLRLIVFIVAVALLLQAATYVRNALLFNSQLAFVKRVLVTTENYTDEESTESDPQEYNPEILALCPETPPNLGPITAKHMELQDSDDVLVELEAGGAYRPIACRARQSVAIIIPDILKESKGVTMTSLYVIHNLLMKQQLDYRIYVVQPANKSNLFISRGLLMNIGFVVADQHRQDWQCFVFHSPSIIPTDTRNLYRCAPEHVRQLVSSITDFSYIYKNKTIRAVNRKRKFGEVQKVPFGHVIAMTKQQIAKVDGFSNGFLPNDGEFGDMRLRLRFANVDIKRSPAAINRYVRLKNTKFHFKETPSIVFKRERMAVTLKPRPDVQDGISTIPFHAQAQDILYLYTSIEVDTSADDRTVSTPQSGFEPSGNLIRVF